MHSRYTCCFPRLFFSHHVLSVATGRGFWEAVAVTTSVNIFRPLLVASVSFLPFPPLSLRRGQVCENKPACLSAAKRTIRGWRRFNRACTKGKEFIVLSSVGQARAAG